ncbi:MAG: prephenate dehydratase, partial [bacterium]|nr:prephenate dehydratase [bacterium]
PTPAELSAAADAPSFPQAPLPPSAFLAIQREVRSATEALLHPLRVAYMGPQSSFTHQAAIKHFGQACHFIPKESIPDVFRAVANAETHFGVAPIENSNEGVVTHTLDMFMDSNVQICAEVLLDIHHHLLSREPLSKIRTVYSHPMGFAQCRRWLATNLPRARLAETYSTAHAAERAARTPHSAAVAAELAAQLYHLPIRARCIEDYANNVTRFLVIGTHIPPRARASKTSLLFSIKDRPGSLYEALKPFKDAGINLTKIESRPSKQRAWEYIFYVDFVGHAEDPVVARALARLSHHCNFVKILGSYPLVATSASQSCCLAD